MAKNIGATLTIKDGNFKTAIKSAISGAENLKKHTTNATGSLNKLGAQGAKTGDKLASLTKKVIGVVAAYAGFRQIVNFSKECIEAANRQQMAETRLEATLANVKGTTQEGIAALKVYAKELQGVTSIGDEATIQGMSQLGTFQLQTDTIKTLTPALQDLAVAQFGTAVSGDQMQQMANLMGKVMAGNVSSLSRYGVIMDETQKNILKTGTESERAAMLVEVLGQNFGGLAEKMANTPAGRVQQLKNAWGDMQEVIGVKLYPIVTNFLTYLTGKIPAIQNLLTGVADAVVPVIGEVFSMLTSAADTIGPILLGVIQNWKLVAAAILPVIAAIGTYKAMVGAVNILQNICNLTLGLSATEMSAMSFSELAAASAKGIHAAATGALTAAQTALNAAFLASPIGWIVLGIAAVVTAVIVLYNKCDTFRNFINKAFQNIVTWAKNTWAGIKSSLEPLIAAIKSAFTQAWEVIKVIWDFVSPYFQMVWNNIKIVFSVVSVYIGGMFNTAWTIIKAVWNTAVGFFTAIWNTIAGIFSVVGSVLTGDWAGAWEGIKGIVSSWGDFFAGVWESIKSIFSAVGSWFSSTFSAAWEGIKAIFSNVASFFQGIWNTITSMFTSIGVAIGDGISGAFKSVINAVIGFAGKIINGFIKSINTAISVINYIPGVNIPLLAEVNLPKLANGGIIASAGSVMVGERGPEILNLPKGASVTPLNKTTNTSNNVFNITINADGKSVDTIIDELVPKLKLALANL